MATLGTLLMAVFVPFTFVFGGAFSMSVYKEIIHCHRYGQEGQKGEESLEGPARLSRFANQLFNFACLCGMLAAAAVGVNSSWATSYGMAANMLHCGILWCDNADDDAPYAEATNYQVTYGLPTFFVSLLAVAYEFVLLIRAIAVVLAPAPAREYESMVDTGFDNESASTQVDLLTNSAKQHRDQGESSCESTRASVFAPCPLPPAPCPPPSCSCTP